MLFDKLVKILKFKIRFNKNKKDFIYEFILNIKSSKYFYSKTMEISDMFYFIILRIKWL